MAIHNLVSFLSEAEIRRLCVGDKLTVDGTIFGIRDATQIRIFDQGVEPPVNLKGHLCLHTAPNVKKVGNRYEKVSIGTTTSTRMERFTPLLIEKYGVRGIIGKGGLLEGSMRAMMEHGACYLAIVGGAAALETTQIQDIEEVYWKDLMPECLWKFRVKDFGPLNVAMDSHGSNLYEKVKMETKRRLPGLYRSLGISL